MLKPITISIRGFRVYIIVSNLIHALAIFHFTQIEIIYAEFNFLLLYKQIQDLHIILSSFADGNTF